MPPAGEVDTVRRKEFRAGYCVNFRFQTLFPILRNDLPDTIRKRHGTVPAEQMVERIDGKFIIVLRNQHLVSALLEVIDRSTGGCLQRGDSFLFLVATFPACPGLILKYHEKATCGSFSGTDLVNEVQVVLLQQTAVCICLLCHLLLHDLSVPVQVSAFGDDFDLHFDRADLQKRDKRVDDIALLSGTAQQEVNGNDLDDFQVSVIPCVDDPVCNLLHR